MTMRTKLRSHLWKLLAGILLCTQAAYAGPYLHPKLKSREKVVRKVFILRPRMEFQKQSMKGAESMFKEADECGAALQTIVSGALQENGLDVLAGVPAAQNGTSEEDANYAVADVESLYDRIEPVLNKKPQDVRNGRFSLGGDVARLDLQSSSDAFIVIRGYGIKLTRGKQAYAWIVPTGNPWPSMSVSIAFVDSRTGDVLFFTRLKKIGNPVEADRLLARRIQKALADFPFQALRK